MEKEAWAGQNEDKWSEVVVFLARGGRVSVAWGEDGEMIVPAPTWIRCLGGNGLFRELETEKFWGDTWLPVLLCAFDDNVVLSLQSWGTWKDWYCTYKSPSSYFSQNVGIVPTKLERAVWVAETSLSTLCREAPSITCPVGGLNLGRIASIWCLSP